MESLIHHFKLFTEGYSVPAGRGLCSGRASEGRVRRLHRLGRREQAVPREGAGPGFAHLSAMSEMVEGHMLADVVAVIGTQDIVFGEVDR